MDSNIYLLNQQLGSFNESRDRHDHILFLYIYRGLRKFWFNNCRYHWYNVGKQVGRNDGRKNAAFWIYFRKSKKYFGPGKVPTPKKLIIILKKLKFLHNFKAHHGIPRQILLEYEISNQLDKNIKMLCSKQHSNSAKRQALYRYINFERIWVI